MYDLKTKMKSKISIAGTKQLQDGKPALPENEKNPEEIEDKPKALPLEDVHQKPEESEHFKEEMEEMRVALTEEIARKHDIISLLRQEMNQLEEKHSEKMKETSIKDDIIRELRKELKKSKQKIANLKKETEKTRIETAEKSINTTDSEFIRITHSNVPQDNQNSTVIFMHRSDEDDRRKENKSTFDSSDSSEYGLSENVLYRSQIHTCKSENDMKLINWMRPTKERSILTKIRKNIEGEEESLQRDRVPKRLNIPRHIPVKTYVNNIEYSK